MMFTQAICMLVAPAIAHAAAFPWALPEPTISAPAPDNWSPAPTTAPQLPGFSLFKRQTTSGDNTCGFVSGSSQSSITCPNTSFICATNTLNGVHGCCDPRSLSDCTIPTTCIPSTAVSTLCTDTSCSSNSAILKCTEAAAPACYKWLISYSQTVMTQHGCAAAPFTSTAQRSWGVQQTSVSQEAVSTASATVDASTSDTPTALPAPGPGNQNLGAIIGGTIGGCTVITLLILAFVIFRRRRKSAKIEQAPQAQYHGPVMQFDPMSPEHVAGKDDKMWPLHSAGPVSRASDTVPQYPGMGTARYGVVEVDGVQRPVEVEGEGNTRGYERSELY